MRSKDKSGIKKAYKEETDIQAEEKREEEPAVRAEEQREKEPAVRAEKKRKGKPAIEAGKAFMADLAGKNIAAFASSAAYFIYMSMIPMMMLLFSILPFTPISKEAVTDTILRFVSPTVESLMKSIISEVYNKSGGFLTLLSITTIWTASGSMKAIIRGLNSVNGYVEKRKYFLVYGFACLYTLIFLVLILATVVVLIFGRFIADRIIGIFPVAATFLNNFLFGRYFISFIFFTLIFALFYAYLPVKKGKYKKQLPGAVFASAAWNAVSAAYSFYITAFNGFSLYGSMAAIVILLFFIYMMMYIFFIGAQINRWKCSKVRPEPK